MKTILVPTDLSPFSLQALEVAAELARTHPARILLLHTVLDEDLAYLSANDSALQFSEELEPAFEKARYRDEAELEAWISHPLYAGIDIQIEAGKTLKGFLECLSDYHPDLIIMASKGASGLKELAGGSHAEAVMQQAHCPVLILKEPIRPFHPRRILTAVDVDNRVPAILPKPFFLNIRERDDYLFVMKPFDTRSEEEIQQLMNLWAQKQQLDSYRLHIGRHSSTAKGILEYATEVSADVLVLFTHARKGIQHFLYGSVAETVLNRAELPVLIIHLS
ncbi:universal stress protein UspA [Siphonobacter sp. BAB-5405]|uniref:universal stress protein n=1 Tax=Siphonobacter sp. BAB-5405 TaxID=1864825 RepID=UPI000C805B12|nr:universal stress protein [Siphonobacter sp. BAB-5405]PMD92285.1 universal stress protein UspA [Siphonobacter sp. BAB-5405]